MAVLREEGSAGSEFPERAPVRDVQRTVPRALLDRETEDAAYMFGLAEDRRAEVTTLMDATAVDFHFLPWCGRNTEVRATRMNHLIIHE